MKKIILLCSFCVAATILLCPVEVSAQKETFDITSYTPPNKWKKEVTENTISYINVNKNNWCRIGIIKSTASKGSIEQDFESEWKELIIKNYNPSETPQLTEVQEADGWKIRAGTAKFTFNNADAIAMLTTMSGFDRCVSIIAVTNSQDYTKDIETLLSSVELINTGTGLQQTPVSNDDKNSIIGTWGKSNMVGHVNNRFGNYSYNKQQYTFSANGSYGFAAKTYDEKSSETFLIKERGNFVISGNTITITPKTSVVETWSKKNGADKWGKLLSSQKRTLEKVTYQFSIADNNLLLQTPKQTARDGNFNTATIYTYGPPGTFTAIILPEGEHILPTEIQKEPVKQTVTQPNSSVTNSGFAFTSTNFDDGWTSTVREDWVEVTKGSMKVLLHYPKEGTIFPADPGPLTNAAWNILVAPRYSNLKNYKTAYITTYDRPYLGMGYATENATGKNIFIVFFRQGQSGWIEFITPDKNTFIQQYKFDPETIQWDSNSDLMIPLANMTVYNKFAIAASDFKGKWTSDFTGIQQLYNVYTGQYAGMNMNQSNEEFIFKDGSTYSWKLLVVNGMVGTAKFNEVKSSGKLTVPNNWQVKFSMIENKARTYHAFWSCIKAARILNLLDADAPGSGIYTKYGLAK